MSRETKRITQYFEKMQLPLNEMALNGFSNSEKKHIERLCERMLYLYNQLSNKTYPTEIKRLLLKDEFRALEWAMWEFGIVDSETYQKIQFEDKGEIS